MKGGEWGISPPDERRRLPPPSPYDTNVRVNKQICEDKQFNQTQYASTNNLGILKGNIANTRRDIKGKHCN